MTRVGGTFAIPVIPIAFKDVSAPATAAALEDVLFGAAPGRPYSLTTYYQEQSRGSLSLGGTVLGWVTADSNAAYYEDGCNGIGVLGPCFHNGKPFGELLFEALAASDTGGFDWGAFDNDGADGLPNSGDDDGVVDFVTFLHAKIDGACGSSGIWSHRFFLGAWNLGQPYVTHSPRRDATGTPIPGQSIVVDDYTIQSAVGGATACDGQSIMPIGTIAHETGHAFGLPDLYDTNLRSPSVTQGIGEWGIMGSGSYSQPESPSRFDAWSLSELGWVTVTSLSTAGWVRLPPVASAGEVLYVVVPSTDEYFLLENRQPIGSDTAQLNPACRFGTRSCAKAPGLLLWHLDQGQIDAHGFQRDNRVNTGPVHGVALVQADGLNDLSIPGGKNRGDAGDPFPGTTGNQAISETSSPATVDNQGASAGFALDSIAQDSGGDIEFRFIPGQAGGVNVTLEQATGEILGHPTLGSAQLGYLDQNGNQNGRYDVGDFLAYLVAHGVVPSESLLLQVGQRARVSP